MEDRKKILVVEDEKNIATVLAYNIKKEGYDCDVAYDGETGLHMATEGSYDLILLDIMLPRLNGFEICEQVRRTSQVPTGSSGSRPARTTMSPSPSPSRSSWRGCGRTSGGPRER